MIIVKLRVKVPSGERADVIDIFDSFIGPVSVQPGCVSAKLYAEINNDDDLILLEEWDSQKNLERHIRSDDFHKFLAVMDMAKEQPEISFHTVSSTQGFELLEGLKG